MSYTPGTILTRINPFEFDEGVDASDLRPYNDVRVVGQNEVRSGAPRSSEWSGQGGDEWDITPLSFGSVVTKPYGELSRDYEIVSIPELEPAVVEKKPQLAERLPSPEEALAAEAEAAGHERSSTRVATPLG